MALPPGCVWLDARGTQSAQHGERGVARYVAEQTRALLRLRPELVGSIGLDPVALIPPSIEPVVGGGLLAWHRRTKAPDNRPPPRIYHVMSPFEMAMEYEDVWPAWIRASGARMVVTLYDLIPLVLREEYLPLWGYNGVAWLARLGLIRSAHQVLTISQHTAEDAMQHLRIPEERITVVDSGVSDLHSSLVSSRDEAEELLRQTLPEARPGFLLYVGGDDPRKNLEGTIQGYAELPERIRDRHQLVIAFRVGPLRRFELQAFAQALGIRPRDLVLTGFVTDEQLAALYRSCDLFIFPSLYEGAGLPILEAMSCGAPVAASRASSIPELLGDLEATFDPSSPADIGRCLEGVLSAPESLEGLRERSERRVKIYTWERVARLTVEGYERATQLPAATPPARRTTQRRKRLAVVTPWPGNESGGARYSRNLVEQLAEHAEVEVIVSADHGESELDRTLESVKLRTDDEFAWLREIRPYDRFLFVVGPSRCHIPAFEAMMSTPGVVLADDVRLFPLYRSLHRYRFIYEPFWLEGKLGAMYVDRIPDRALGPLTLDPDRAIDAVPMTAEVQSHAERVLVHSRYQAELLRLDNRGGDAPVEVVPFAIPLRIVSGNGTPAGGPVILASRDSLKRAEFKAAFERVLDAHPRARLESFGGEEELDPDTVASARVAVCLTSDAQGGRPSGAIARLIGARVPMVVSEIGWQAEVPDPVVTHVHPECDAETLRDRLSSLIGDEDTRRAIREAQDFYADRNSFARVAERYAELLSL